MMHHRRTWHIATVDDPAELARKLSGPHSFTWCGCCGFRLPLPGSQNGSLLFLNDATSPDGAQEYGAVRLDAAQDERLCLRLGRPVIEGIQVESITFSWCSEEEALRHIRYLIDPDGVVPPNEDIFAAKTLAQLSERLGTPAKRESYHSNVRVQVDYAERHHCALCA